MAAAKKGGLMAILMASKAKGKAEEPDEEAAETPDEEQGEEVEAAQGLIDALASKDAARVAKALRSCMAVCGDADDGED